MEWTEVADTLVKVGGGAFIGGVLSLMSMRMSLRHADKQAFDQVRRQHLLDAVAKLEAVHTAAEACLAGARNGAADCGKDLRALYGAIKDGATRALLIGDRDSYARLEDYRGELDRLLALTAQGAAAAPQAIAETEEGLQARKISVLEAIGKTYQTR